MAFEPDNLLPNIFQPAIEPDLKVASPSAVIEEDALASVDGAPPIEAGVRILFAVMSP